MLNRIIEQVVISVIASAITGIINLVTSSNINILYLSSILLIIYIIINCYKNYFKYPNIIYRVTNNEDNKGLLFYNGNNQATGIKINEAWKFTANGTQYNPIYGPYIREPLRKGKYKAIYKLKVERFGNENAIISNLDVVSILNGRRGEKTLAHRIITTRDINKCDEYQDINLSFDVLSDESDVEFRISPTNGYTLTLEYIRLIRGLF